MATKRIRNGVDDRLLSDGTPHQMPKAAGWMEKSAEAVRRPLAVGVAFVYLTTRRRGVAQSGQRASFGYWRPPVRIRAPRPSPGDNSASRPSAPVTQPQAFGETSEP